LQTKHYGWHVGAPAAAGPIFMDWTIPAWVLVALSFLWAAVKAMAEVAKFLATTDPETAERNAVKWLRLNWARIKRFTQKRWVRIVSPFGWYGGGIILGILIAPMLERVDQVDPKFQQFQRAQSGSIGRAIAPSEASSFWLEGHEHAHVVWSSALGMHYALFPNGKTISQHDIDWEVREWYDEDRNRRRLNLPQSCSPPLGGVARAWNNDPNTWSPIGCRTSICSTPALVQRFTNGNILGPLPYEPSGDPGNSAPILGRLIFISNDGTWSNYSALSNPAKCNTKMPG
jgi:hypothetical protein